MTLTIASIKNMTATDKKKLLKEDLLNLVLRIISGEEKVLNSDDVMTSIEELKISIKLQEF